MFVLSQKIQNRTIFALLATKPSAAPMFISGQEQLIKDITIFLQNASCFIFRRRIRTATKSFVVLSYTSKDRFRIYKADLTNSVSMVNTLQLPSEALTLALASNQGKQLKLTAPTTILEKACAQKLDTALVVLRLNAGEVIRQLENVKKNSKEPGKELLHKEPQPSLTLQQIIKRDGKPVQISI
jgi:hypothetical protein